MYKPVKNSAPKTNVVAVGVIVVLAAIPCFAAIALFSSGLAFTFNGFNFKGENSVKDEAGEIDPVVEKIEIINKHGFVTISSNTEPKWHWELTTWADTKEEAQLIEKLIEMHVTEANGKQIWELKLPEDMSGCNGFKSNLTISVPASVEAIVTNRHGDVDVKDVSGGVTIVNAHGDVECTSVPSAVNVENRHGDIAVYRVAEAKIDSAHGDIVVSDSEGNVEIDSQHGDVEIEDVGDSIKLQCSFADITSKGIKGNVEIENQHGDIRLDCFSEKIICRNQHGDVAIVIESDQVKSVDVTCNHGEIAILLPDSIRPNISATASHGDVHNEFESNPDGIVSIKLKSTFDDIRIKQHAVAVSKQSPAATAEAE